jgi:hypothetical protein
MSPAAMALIAAGEGIFGNPQMMDEPLIPP